MIHTSFKQKELQLAVPLFVLNIVTSCFSLSFHIIYVLDSPFQCGNFEEKKSNYISMHATKAWFKSCCCVSGHPAPVEIDCY